MDSVNEIIERLGNSEDAVRKMAAFKLQSNIADPSFAEMFIIQGGIIELRELAMNANGNTLAYSLTSFSRLLEVDKGWEYVTPELIARMVDLITGHPLINILRGAMAVLGAIVAHPQLSEGRGSMMTGLFGFSALKPAISEHPEFLEMLVERVSSADHALCANALQLINALMRDSIASDSEWQKFIKRLQDLGVIRTVYYLMQGSSLQDLAHPLLEFQALMKMLIRKWRAVKLNLERKDHRTALKTIHIASASSIRSNPEKWRRLGFESESPAWEFEQAGFLGMMDMTEFVKDHEDEFQKIIHEQEAKPKEERFPFARASLYVTSLLCEQFAVDNSEADDAKTIMILESRASFEKAFKPLLLQWSRLHTAALFAFFRLWKETSAVYSDFDKVSDLVRVLGYKTMVQATRTKEVADVEGEFADYDYQRLRVIQMELLEQAYGNAWRPQLTSVYEETAKEAQEFIKEQRIRCLLQGSWFTTDRTDSSQKAKDKPAFISLFARLSSDRRFLCYGYYNADMDIEPRMEDLVHKIPMSSISSVISNVTPIIKDNRDSSVTVTTATPANFSSTTTKLTIYGKQLANGNHHNGDSSKEFPLIVLHPSNHTIASEWLDGLLFLMGKKPITSETSNLINTVAKCSMKVRLLSVRYTDIYPGPPDIPSRDGVDDDFFYS
ncbi:hypothetical protein H072_5181 [Dactylellina haptotyla CBS 200.50]|uniref:ELMO domain-containing protein n=1 Tax=Dactylellina haptotyla (strain CBS 200.50) TaxID=1284197 RepID=S8BNA7_DACHA|nr:hypothetical protein H072_5181 [Dactylellina haptotyla CBS 200.50]